jgi:hypothetical protein
VRLQLHVEVRAVHLLRRCHRHQAPTTRYGRPPTGYRGCGRLDELDAVRKARGSFLDIGRAMPVVGHGFGVLPRLFGEAHGVVGNAGNGVGTLRLVGAAVGEVDDDLELMLLLLAA